MNLLSSNLPLPGAVGGTAGATHSLIGVPLAPKLLNRSSVLASMSVVRASVGAARATAPSGGSSGSTWFLFFWPVVAGDSHNDKAKDANRVRASTLKSFDITNSPPQAGNQL